jgi:hypothetical protein
MYCFISRIINRTISISEAAEILSKEAGRRISYADIPEQEALEGLRECYG